MFTIRHNGNFVCLFSGKMGDFERTMIFNYMHLHNLKVAAFDIGCVTQTISINDLYKKKEINTK